MNTDIVRVQCEHYTIGKYFTDDRDAAGFTVVRRSRGLDQPTIRRVQSAVNIGPVVDIDAFSGAYGLFSVDQDYLTLTRFYRSPRPQPRRGVYFLQTDNFIVKRKALLQLRGNFRYLIRELPPTPDELYTEQKDELDPYVFTMSVSRERDQEIMQQTFGELGQDFIMGIVAALLLPEQVAITDFPEDEELRLNLLETIVLAAPFAMRPTITLATLTYDAGACNTRIKFLAGRGGAPGHTLASWANRRVSLPRDFVIQNNPYVALLKRHLEANSIDSLLNAIEKLSLPDDLSFEESRRLLPKVALIDIGVPLLRQDIVRGTASYTEIVQCVRTLGTDLEQSDRERFLTFILDTILNDSGNVQDAALVVECDPSLKLQYDEVVSKTIDAGHLAVLNSVLNRWAQTPSLSSAWREYIYRICEHEFSYLRRVNQASRAIPLFKDLVTNDLSKLLPDGRIRLLGYAATALSNGSVELLLPEILTTIQDRQTLDSVLDNQDIRTALQRVAPDWVTLLERLRAGEPVRDVAAQSILRLKNPELLLHIGELGFRLSAHSDLYSELLTALYEQRSRLSSIDRDLVSWVNRLATVGPIHELSAQSQWTAVVLARSDVDTVATVLSSVALKSGQQALDQLLELLVQQTRVHDGAVEHYLQLLNRAQTNGVDASTRFHMALFILRQLQWQKSSEPLAEYVSRLAFGSVTGQLEADDLNELLDFAMQSDRFDTEAFKNVANLTFEAAFRHDNSADIAEELRKLRISLNRSLGQLRSEPAKKEKRGAYFEALQASARKNWRPSRLSDVTDLIDSLISEELYEEALLIEQEVLNFSEARPTQNRIAGQIWAKRLLEFEYLVSLFSGVKEQDFRMLDPGSVRQGQAEIIVESWNYVQEQLSTKGRLPFGTNLPDWLSSLRAFVDVLRRQTTRSASRR